METPRAHTLTPVWSRQKTLHLFLGKENPEETHRANSTQIDSFLPSLSLSIYVYAIIHVYGERIKLYCHMTAVLL